ncbi:MAG: nucleotide sugar dehydrogenase [Candidatus Asgardarchaeum californiense]|nr:MAG: nucleotide sugar dehydrogenase [Candidatus Asgardarchaeum californiense]
MKLYRLPKDKLKSAISSGNVTIAVYGLGKLGLPLAVTYANFGFNVIGVDINEKIVDTINSGKSYLVNEPGVDEGVRKNVSAGRLKATTNGVNAAKEADVMVSIVPTLIDDTNRPDLTYMMNSVETIAKGLTKGDIVLIESTLPPGTTEGPIREMLEKVSGLKAGVDFGLAYSPERTSSGQVIADIVDHYPKIIGGLDEHSTRAIAAIYSKIAKKGVIVVRDIRTAEAVKVFEGVYRDVNIALANELALLTEKLGVDIIEAINAANSQPYSHIHIPGAGVGGHCIPLYPYFLLDVANKQNVPLRITSIARQLNEYMPYHMVELIADALNECEKPIKNSKIGILGLTFRGDVKATYHTPAAPLIKILQEKGAKITAHDPLLSPDEIKSEFGIDSAKSFDELFRDADCIVVVTAHSLYKNTDFKKYFKLMRRPAAVVDGRHIFNPDKMDSEGIVFRGVGRVFKNNK